MNARLSRFVVAVAALLGVVVSASSVQAVPVSFDLTRLLAIQTYALEDKAPDDVFLIVRGVEKGKEMQFGKLPINGTWKVDPKSPAIEPEKPMTIWKGDLGDGEFVLLTVTLFQGKGNNATVKSFVEKMAEAEKGVAGRNAEKLTAEQAKALAANTHKAHQSVIKNIKQIAGGREKNTDHYGGQFTLLLWNNAGKIVKRLDPVGLTFGEHKGIDVKTYSKIKRTRRNVWMKDDAGGWYEEEMLPTNDEDDGIRVKMLDTEYLKAGDQENKNVTDYLAEIQVKVDGKPVRWRAGGENPGESDIHFWWDWAE